MVAPWKIKLVQDLKNMLTEYDVIGVADVSTLPTKQFQIIRKKTHDFLKIKVVKKRLLFRAIEELLGQKPELEKLKELIEKRKNITIALLLAKKYNPFKLYKILQESKSPAPAKPGAIAPKDIVIPAGPTPFTPGPMIGELSRLGFKVKVEGGKIVIQEDKVVVREGEEITPEIAELLNKFGIEPLEVGIDVLGLLHDGILYTKEVLEIDEEEYRRNVMSAIQEALNIVLHIGFPVKEFIDVLLSYAYQNALKLSLETGIPTKDNIELLLSRARSLALAVSSYLPDELKPEEVKREETLTQEQEEKTEKKNEETSEKEKAENALVGLGSLFG